MLNVAQRAKCRSLAEALDRGDLKLWRKAEGRLSAEEKSAVWGCRRGVVAVGQREAAARPAAITNAVTASRIETRSLDLDYWPDTQAAEPTDDDDSPNVLPRDAGEDDCSECGGTGKNELGDDCETCGGTGRVSAREEDEEDNDDEEE